MHNFSGTTHAFTGTVTINGNTVVPYDNIGISIDGGGSPITTGIKGRAYLGAGYSATIGTITLLADTSGYIEIDILSSTYGNFPSTTSIVSLATPTINTAQKSQATLLTGWSTGLTGNSVIEYSVVSCQTITWCSLSLDLVKY